MSPSMIDRLSHIAAAIMNINEALEHQTRESFSENMLHRMAVERLLEIISEASRHLPEELKRQGAEINWRRLADLGNALRHAYHRIDALLLWDMARNDLPPLKAFTETALEEVKRSR